MTVSSCRWKFEAVVRVAGVAAVLGLFALAGCQNTASPPDGNPSSQSGAVPQPVVTPLPGQPGAASPGAPAPELAVPPPTPEPALTLRPPPEEAGKVRVALLLPLSGQHAALGRALLDGALLALFQVADANFVLIPFDTAGTPEGATAAATAAVEERAQLAIGPVFSGEVSAATPVFARVGINMLPLSNDSTVAGPGVYLSGLLPEAQVGRVVRYAATRGVRTFGALLPDGPLGVRVRAALQNTVTALGLPPARTVYYGSSTEDIARAVRSISGYESRRAALLAQRKALAASEDEGSRRALERLKSLDTFGPIGFDGLVVAASGTQLTEVAAQLGNFDIETKRTRLLGLSSWAAEGTGREPALVGAWFAAAPQKTALDVGRDFKAMFGADMHPLATSAFDLTALAAILAARDDGPHFDRDTLTGPNGFSGVSGLFRFRPDGLPERGLEVREVEPWGSKVIEPAPVSFENPTN